MARIQPFHAYRYSPAAGRPEDLVTQPYDKISPAMQARYLSLSPYNLVRIILGERFSTDSDSDSVYTRAKGYLTEWIDKGILDRDAEPSLYAYSQEFKLPDSDEVLTRKGFVGLCAIEDYEAKVVHRHEQTLSGPKKDRLELLRHTRAHFGQLFMLYSDPEQAVDNALEAAIGREPDVSVVDEYDTLHRLWRISDPALIATIQHLMSDKKLLIADGHHRYETALAFRNENPDSPDSKYVMMTFVNMNAPGLKILATHRVVSNLPSFDAHSLIQGTNAQKLPSLDALKEIFANPAPDRVRIGIALAGGATYLVNRPRHPGDLDVKVLHEDILAKVLNIGEESVRNESYLQYVRGIDAAVDKVETGGAQAAFLLEPTTIQQTADVAFSGGVMPQKSTDFYPKLLSGLTIYKTEK